MSRIRDQYQEVDELLSSALPSAIAEAFRQNQIREDAAVAADSTSTRGRTGSSASQAIVSDNGDVSSSRRKSQRCQSRERSSSRARANGSAQVDLGEDEPLLPASQEREEKREQRNALALNGQSAPHFSQKQTSCRLISYDRSQSTLASISSSYWRKASLSCLHHPYRSWPLSWTPSWISYPR